MKVFKRLLPWRIFATLVALCCCLFPYGPIHDGIEGESVSNVKQIAMAIAVYHEAFHKFPPAAARDKDGKPLYSWRVLILPFIEHDSLYKQFKLDEPWDSPHNLKLLEKMPPVYALPSQTEPGKTYYQVFIGPGTAFEKEGLTAQDFPDGLDKTLFVLEAGEAVPWTKPVDLEYDLNKPLPPLKQHYSKGVFLMKRYCIYNIPSFSAGFGDGQVYSLPFPCDEKLLRAWITRNGGETVALPAR